MPCHTADCRVSAAWLGCVAEAPVFRRQLGPVCRGAHALLDFACAQGSLNDGAITVRAVHEEPVFEPVKAGAPHLALPRSSLRGRDGVLGRPGIARLLLPSLPAADRWKLAGGLWKVSDRCQPLSGTTCAFGSLAS